MWQSQPSSSPIPPYWHFFLPGRQGIYFPQRESRVALRGKREIPFSARNGKALEEKNTGSFSLYFFLAFRAERSLLQVRWPMNFFSAFACLSYLRVPCTQTSTGLCTPPHAPPHGESVRPLPCARVACCQTGISILWLSPFLPSLIKLGKIE